MECTKILFIDDDEDDALILKEAFFEVRFQSWHYEATLEAGWKFLLDCKKDRLPSLIICDFRISGATALEFLQKVKRSDDFRQIPLVVISTSISPTDIDEIKAFGATYASKPLTYGAFVRFIQDLLAMHKNELYAAQV